MCKIYFQIFTLANNLPLTRQGSYIDERQWRSHDDMPKQRQGDRQT